MGKTRTELRISSIRMSEEQQKRERERGIAPISHTARVNPRYYLWSLPPGSPSLAHSGASAAGCSATLSVNYTGHTSPQSSWNITWSLRPNFPAYSMTFHRVLPSASTVRCSAVPGRIRWRFERRARKEILAYTVTSRAQ